jgi:putative molybdopterin biosynthesis protein
MQSGMAVGQIPSHRSAVPTRLACAAGEPEPARSTPPRMSVHATQEQFLEVIDRDEAERRFRAVLRLQPLGAETVLLDAALGRVAADDIAARGDVPSFDRSDFDGFAVRAADTYGATEEQPRYLELLPEVIAPGKVPQSAVDRGTAATIATGGMLPRGADAVVMIEHTDVVHGGAGPQLAVRKAVSPGHGVTFAGTDITAGEIVVRRGEILTSRETSVLAAVGVDRLQVWRRPRVAILSTGDELVEPGAPIRPGQIYDSNAQTLAHAVRELGAEPLRLGIAPDDASRLRDALRHALQSADVVLLSGGTSKGAGDVSYRVLRELTQPGIVAHGVALKPGKPICLAAHQGKPVVVLPGFPTSAIFTFHEFVAPVIRILAGRTAEPPSTVVARLAVKVNSQVGRTEYLLVGLVERSQPATASAAAVGDDELRRTVPDSAPAAPSDEPPQPALAAYPMGKGSGSVTAFSRADGFITIPRNQELLEAGAPVRVQLLGRQWRVADLVVIGSHCVGLDYLLGRVQEAGYRTRFLAVGSTAGLHAASRGECDVAGIHLLDPDSGVYNTPFVRGDLCLLSGYRRRQGIVFRPGDPRFEGKTAPQAVADAASRDDCVMVNRNQGSGTRILIDQLLGGAQPPGYAVAARNHHAVAAAVAQGRADWGVAIWWVARLHGLGFLPLCDEQYDFVIPAARWNRPAVGAFRQLLESPSVRAVLASYGLEARRSADSAGENFSSASSSES